MKYIYGLLITLLFLTIPQLTIAQGCPIGDFKAETDTCTSDSTYLLYVTMEYQNPTDSFNLYVDDVYHGTFQYQELPVKIDYAQGNGGLFDVIRACHAGIPNCCKVTKVGLPDCFPSQGCAIKHLDVDVTQCHNDTFFVNIDFQAVYPTSQEFKVFINGVLFGLFDYVDLPIDLGPIVDQGNDFEVSVADSANDDCSDSEELESPICDQLGPCEIEDLEVEPIKCTADTFYLEIDFDHDNTGNNGFHVMIDSQDYGSYNYGFLPIEIGPFVDDSTEIEVQVTDNDFPVCSATQILNNIDCTPQTSCQFDDISIDLGDCTSDNTYTLTFDFDVISAKDSFDLYANSNTYLDRYAYVDLPITIVDFPTNGGPFDHIKICNVGPPNCCSVKKFLVPPCIGLFPHHFITADYVNIYPNPGTDVLKIRPEEKLRIEDVYLIKQDGRQIKLSNRGGAIDISAFQSGMYFLLIETDKGSVLKELLISE